MATKLVDTSCKALQCSISRLAAFRTAKAVEMGLVGPVVAIADKQNGSKGGSSCVVRAVVIVVVVEKGCRGEIEDCKGERKRRGISLEFIE
jgi:hypothetical protein